MCRNDLLNGRPFAIDPMFARCGQALYGDRWQTQLARSIGVSDRSVRGWAAGGRPVPPGVWKEIADLIRQHQQALSAVLQELTDA